MGAVALVRLEGEVNRTVTIDGVEYYSYDWESFKTPDDTKVYEQDQLLDKLLNELCDICSEHSDENQILTALVDLNSLQITKMNLEDEPE
jgi:hypothetical protein